MITFLIQTLTGYRYLNDKCPATVKWIMFHDDDALINLEKAIKFFDGPMAKEMNCFGRKLKATQIGKI